jgi:hypothetical protein
MYHGYIDVPTFAYFDFGNTWMGSLLGDLNYRIVPLAKEEPPVLKVYVWYGKLCFELSEMSEEFEEELSDEGYQRVIARINAIADEYRKK